MLGGLPPPSRRLPRICLLQDQIGGHDGGSREGGGEGDENARGGGSRGACQRINKSCPRLGSDSENRPRERRDRRERSNDHRAFPHPPPLPFSSSFDSTVSNGTTFFPDLRNHANRPENVGHVSGIADRREAVVARGRGGELCAHKSRGNIYRRKKNPWIDTTVESACSGGSVGRGSDSLRIGARA